MLCPLPMIDRGLDQCLALPGQEHIDLLKERFSHVLLSSTETLGIIKCLFVHIVKAPGAFITSSGDLQQVSLLMSDEAQQAAK